MAESKQQAQQPKKMSYDELQKVAGDLSIQYQKAVQHIRNLEKQLQDASFGKMGFLLESMFKVMDHHELYEEDFVKWVRDSIQVAVATFSDTLNPEPEKSEEKTEGESREA